MSSKKADRSSRTQLNANKVMQELARKLQEVQNEITKRNESINSIQKEFSKMQQLYLEEKSLQPDL